MKIAIYSQKYKEEYHKILCLVLENLKENQDEIYIEQSFWNEFSQKSDKKFTAKTFTSYHDLNDSFDFMLTIGGDGTILRAITFVRDLPIPILGINAGRLGFLATICKEEIQQMFEKLRKKEFKIEERSLLQVFSEDGSPITDENFALNEVSVVRKNTTSMISIETTLNENYLTTYWADGLIIATPTGSTGYSLSCGGPVMMPQSETLVMTPIAPHNLNARPLIIPDNIPISLSVFSREESYFISFDARLQSVCCQTKIIVKKAPFSLKMIYLEGYSFFKTLRNKLLWGQDQRN